MTSLKLVTFITFILAATLSAQEQKTKNQQPGATPEERPNFIVIFIDDLGFADIQPFSDRFPTPNLARMAARGTYYRRAYRASVGQLRT